MTKRVTGLGGIMFKVKNPQQSRDWYRKHLGIESESWGAVFKWREFEHPEREAYSVWSPSSEQSDYFAPSTHSYMINYRVENLDALLESLRAEGIEPVGTPESNEFGKFAWILDPDGSKIELWEPPANEENSNSAGQG